MHHLGEARLALRRYFGYADFRPGQEAVVGAVLAGRDTLAVLPTGGGKSVCYQVPALVLDGLVVVVSPLISLMEDQVAACRRRGIAAAALTSTTPLDERRQVVAALDGRRLRLLYLSPERLAAQAASLRRRSGPPVLLAVDEAHCIAEWGPDFRPAFRRLGAARQALGWPPCVALTGSATELVRRDIAGVLGLGARRRPVAQVQRSFDRPNLRFEVRRVSDEVARRDALLQLLGRPAPRSIVYAATRNVTEALVRLLRLSGHRADPYHAGLAGGDRAAILRRFVAGGVDVVVATCAFGMGIDVPDVRLVVHWAMPASPEAYYQEAGRAGRDGAAARCVLLFQPGDARVHRRMLEVTLPSRRVLRRAWRDAAFAARLPDEVRASVERLRGELVGRGGRIDWAPYGARRRAALRRLRLMARYAGAWRCRRRRLLAYFGDPLVACAGCDRCAFWQRLRGGQVVRPVY